MIKLMIEDVKKQILSEQYYNFPGTSMVVCCLTLRNGFHVSADSCSFSIEDFDEATHKNRARDAAFNKVIDLEAYMLRQKIFCFGER